MGKDEMDWNDGLRWNEMIWNWRIVIEWMELKGMKWNMMDEDNKWMKQNEL